MPSYELRIRFSADDDQDAKDQRDDLMEASENILADSVNDKLYHGDGVTEVA